MSDPRLPIYAVGVSGTIQSIERAAAMLRLLGAAGRPLALGEVASPLDLPRPTAHGILRTLREVGFVDQDRGTGRYTLGVALRRLDEGGCDGHELRARAMNWADSLAGSVGQEVILGMPAGPEADAAGVRVVHHVFRPDGSPQRLRTGELLPLHATAVGKCLLAFAPVAVPLPDELDLQPYTGRTLSTVGRLAEHLAAARHRGWVGDTGEHRAGVGGVAAPIRTGGGLVVGVLGVEGPLDELFDAGGTPVARLVEQLRVAAREISRGLGTVS
jgi:DNA-binding IclR family transcriptional regulator